MQGEGRAANVSDKSGGLMRRPPSRSTHGTHVTTCGWRRRISDAVQTRTRTLEACPLA